MCHSVQTVQRHYEEITMINVCYVTLGSPYGLI